PLAFPHLEQPEIGSPNRIGGYRPRPNLADRRGRWLRAPRPPRVTCALQTLTACAGARSSASRFDGSQPGSLKRLLLVRRPPRSGGGCRVQGSTRVPAGCANHSLL